MPWHEIREQLNYQTILRSSVAEKDDNRNINRVIDVRFSSQKMSIKPKKIFYKKFCTPRGIEK